MLDTGTDLTKPNFDILLPGDYFFDLIYAGLSNLPTLGCELYSDGILATGGATYITAVSLHRLGTKVGWAGTFGDDYYSRSVYDLAEQEGLNMVLAKRLDRPYRRVTTAMAHQGERAFVTYIDPEEPDIADYWCQSMDLCTFRHVHFGGLIETEILRPLVEKAHAYGATVSMDCQDQPQLGSDYDWAGLLSMLDIFMPNAREAKIITGVDDCSEAARRLTRWCKLVVLKDGSNGAFVATNDAHTPLIHQPALPIKHVVDTTGAGDCFNAGFLYGHIVERTDLSTCARYGNICGGLSVTAMGGATNAPSYQELQRHLN